MQAKRFQFIKRQLLVVAIFLALWFSAIGMGDLASVQAQEGGTEPGEKMGIVGGGPADPGEYPWQVELNIYDPSVGGIGLCGGTLIHPQWVVTAAHCITQNNGVISLPGNVYVYAGEYDRSGTYGYTFRAVSQVIRHPSYDTTSFAFTFPNDIALLQLSTPLTLGEGSMPPYTRIGTIPPAPASIGALDGYFAWVTGWGATSEGGGSVLQLREVQVPVIANSVCNDGSHYNGQITSGMLCAGYDAGGLDSCQGDSGGPLVVMNPTTGKWNLAGVVSSGYGCARPYYQGVYTRVSEYASWLQTYLPASTLTVSTSANGSVTSNPAGVNCPGDCTQSYGFNTLVTLTATPAAGYMLSGWTGACAGTANTCTIALTEASSANATFVPKLFNDVSKWTSSFDLSHGWTVQDFVRTLGDVNADGRDDLVGFGLDGVYVSLSTGSSPFPAPTKWTSSFDLSHGWTVQDFVRTVGDVNADGRADLVGFGLDGVYVSLSTGSGFPAPTKWTSSFDLSHGWTVQDFVRTVGDVNADGRADLVGFGLDGVYVSLSTGSSFPAPTKWTSSFDLSHGWTVSGFVRTVGDVNGDGRDDLVGFGLDGVYVSLSTGSSFPAPTKWTSSFDLSHGWTVSGFVRTVGDANADGMDDLIGFGSNGVYIALSTGSGFGSVSRWTNDLDLSHGWTVSSFVRTVGDVNLDNQADLVGFGLDGVYIATNK